MARNEIRCCLFLFLALLLPFALTATNVTGTYTTSQNWTVAGSPYIMTGTVTIAGSSNPTLSIAAGVLIKANSNTTLNIGSSSNPGAIQAIGTAASPITFQPNTGTPTRGYYKGIKFTSLGSGNISYAYIQYAVDGVNLADASPTLHHVHFENGTTGLRTTGVSHPVLYENNFLSNTNGVINGSPSSTTINSWLSWWGTTDGPSGSGPGTGQSISTGVAHEPWLLAIENDSQYISSATVLNRTFNPSISVWTLNFATLTSQTWTLTIKNSLGSTIRTFSGTGSSGSVVWDSKDSGGVTQADGTYTYQLDSTGATSATGKIVIDSNKHLTLSALSLTYQYFSPNGDSVQETSTVTSITNFEDAAWTVTIKDVNDAVIRTATGSGAAISYVWDGKNGSGVLQPDAVYTFVVGVTEGTESASGSVSTTLDTTYATAVIDAPTQNQTLSNVYQNGATDVNVIGTANDPHFSNWQLDRGTGSNPSSWTTLKTGTSPVISSSFYTWLTDAIANNTYTLRLQVWDTAGNRTELRRTVTIANFSMSQSVDQFSSTTGATVKYTSVVPFTVTEDLVVKNDAGVVRELFNGSRNAGTFYDYWNGLNQTGGLLPDGGYLYSAHVSAGAQSMDWDLSDVLGIGGAGSSSRDAVDEWNPFGNEPFVVTYNFSHASMVVFQFGYPVSGDEMYTNCDAPYICPVNFKYEESGSHTVSWAGIDDAGVYRTDFSHWSIQQTRIRWQANAVVIYGTRPVISGALVTVNPPIFEPVYTGNQTVNFTLSTYQSQAVTVTVRYINQSSYSTLRTITTNNVAAGAVSIPFDGRADNGTYVAPGKYAVLVTVTDSIGNVVTGQIMTTVVY